MAGPPSEFATLLRQFRAGSDAAGREICDRFGEHLRRVISRRLDVRLRRQFDSVDLTQAVWASFLAAPEDRPFDTAAEFQAYLNRLAIHKLVNLFRRHGNDDHPLRQVRSIDGSVADLAKETAAPGPSPSQTAIGREAWDELIRDEKPLHREILTRLRDGQGRLQIAEELGVSLKLIQRLISRLEFGDHP